MSSGLTQVKGITATDDEVGGTITGATISNSTITGSPISGSTGSFTTLSANNVVVNGAVSATTVAATGNITGDRVIASAATIFGTSPVAYCRVSCGAGTNNPEILGRSINITSVSALAAGSYSFNLTTAASSANDLAPLAIAYVVADTGPRSTQIRFIGTSVIQVQVYASAGFVQPNGLVMICYGKLT